MLPIPIAGRSIELGLSRKRASHHEHDPSRVCICGVIAGDRAARGSAGADLAGPAHPVHHLAGGGRRHRHHLPHHRRAVVAAVGQQVVVENRPGGGNVIGTQAAARSAPNGYTFFFASAAALVTDPYTFKSLPYDPIKDFETISSIAEVSFMVLAHPSVPAKTLPELIAHAKAAPG